MEISESGRRPSEARSRLLSTAARVFYAEGIHRVGIDRIVAEAHVTRATLYRHFPGKEDLVLAYLDEADRAIRAQADQAIAAGLPAADTLRALARSIAAGIGSPHFRGCAFLNAVAEYPDPACPGTTGGGPARPGAPGMQSTPRERDRARLVASGPTMGAGRPQATGGRDLVNRP